MEDNIVEWTGVTFTNPTRAAEDRTGLKGIVVKSYVVSPMLPPPPQKKKKKKKKKKRKAQLVG